MDKNVLAIDKQIENEVVLSGQVQSYAVLPGNEVRLMYLTDGIKKGVNKGDQTIEIKSKIIKDAAFHSSYNVLVYKPFSDKDILVAASLKRAKQNNCDNFCSHKGVCVAFPYSTHRDCLCQKGFTGTKCELREDNRRLKQVVNLLLKETLTLPTFATIQHAIADAQLYLKISSENIQESIIKLGTKMGEFMSNKVQLA